MNDNICPSVLKTHKILKKIGQGSFGQVFKCLSRKDSQLRAIKKVGGGSGDARVYREVSYMSLLSHSNIVKYYGHSVSASGRDVYIEMEFLGRDLAGVLKYFLLYV